MTWLASDWISPPCREDLVFHQFSVGNSWCWLKLFSLRKFLLLIPWIFWNNSILPLTSYYCNRSRQYYSKLISSSHHFYCSILLEFSQSTYRPQEQSSSPLAFSNVAPSHSALLFFTKNIPLPLSYRYSMLSWRVPQSTEWVSIVRIWLWLSWCRHRLIFRNMVYLFIWCFIFDLTP